MPSAISSRNGPSASGFPAAEPAVVGGPERIEDARRPSGQDFGEPAAVRPDEGQLSRPPIGLERDPGSVGGERALAIAVRPFGELAHRPTGLDEDEALGEAGIVEEQRGAVGREGDGAVGLDRPERSLAGRSGDSPGGGIEGRDADRGADVAVDERDPSAVRRCREVAHPARRRRDRFRRAERTTGRRVEVDPPEVHRPAPGAREEEGPAVPGPLRAPVDVRVREETHGGGGVRLRAVGGDREEVPGGRGVVEAPEGDPLPVRRPARLDGVVGGEEPPLARLDLHRPERARGGSGERAPELLSGDRELPAVRGPGRVVALVGDLPRRLARRAHHEDPAAGALRAVGDAPAVGREGGLVVVGLAARGQVHGVRSPDPLQEDVALAADLLDVGEALPVGRERGGHLAPGEERQLAKAGGLLRRGRRLGAAPHRPEERGRDEDAEEKGGEREGRAPGHGRARRCGRRRRRRRGRGLPPSVEEVLDDDAGVGHVVQPSPRVAFEAAAEEVADGRRQAGREKGPVGVGAQDRGERVAHRLAGEEPLSREHLPEDDAEGPDVGALVHRLAAGLLGAHVGRGPEDHAGLGPLARHRRGAGGVARVQGGGGVAREGLGEAEVEDLDLAVGRELDVGGLEVAVDDALAVGLLERLGDLPRDGERLVDGERAAREPLREVLARHQLHRQRHEALALLEPVDRRDIRVAERREDLRLAAEAREALGVLGEGGRQDLERGLAAELRVPRAVHLSHPSRAESHPDLVRAEPHSGRHTSSNAADSRGGPARNHNSRVIRLRMPSEQPAAGASGRPGCRLSEKAAKARRPTSGLTSARGARASSRRRPGAPRPLPGPESR